MIGRDTVNAWLSELKEAWEAGDAERAVKLFPKTEYYYERPFKPGTTQQEIRQYWRDIVHLRDIVFDFEIIAIEGNTACVHWQNSFRNAPDWGQLHRLDGMFLIEFDEDSDVRVFRQWWFME